MRASVSSTGVPEQAGRCTKARKRLRQPGRIRPGAASRAQHLALRPVCVTPGAAAAGRAATRRDNPETPAAAGAAAERPACRFAVNASRSSASRLDGVGPFRPARRVGSQGGKVAGIIEARQGRPHPAGASGDAQPPPGQRRDRQRRQARHVLPVRQQIGGDRGQQRGFAGARQAGHADAQHRGAGQMPSSRAPLIADAVWSSGASGLGASGGALDQLDLVAVRVLDEGDDGGAVLHRPRLAHHLAAAGTDACRRWPATSGTPTARWPKAVPSS